MLLVGFEPMIPAFERAKTVIIRCYEIVLWRQLCLLFVLMYDVKAPSHVRVFHGAACLLLPCCV
jgi:hypothetical protein